MSKRKKNHTDFFEKVWLLTNILILASLLPLLVRFLSLPQLMKLLTPKNIKVPKNIEFQKYRIMKFVDNILNKNILMWKKTCLKRCLIQYYFLRKIGIQVRIFFGVRYKKFYPCSCKKREIEGHSWLLLNDSVFFDEDREQVNSYNIIYSFPQLE
jgi:hypothetical protein